MLGRGGGQEDTERNEGDWGREKPGRGKGREEVRRREGRIVGERRGE